MDKILKDLQVDESVYGGLEEAHEYYNKKVTKCTLKLKGYLQKNWY